MHDIIRSKKFQVLLFIIISCTTLIFFNWRTAGTPSPFYTDPETLKRIEIATNLDPDTRTLYITRLLHNKPLFYLGTFLISFYRSIDPIYLFSLPGPSSMFEVTDKMYLLHPIEFPFFVFSSFYFIRHWKELQKKYWYILILLFISFFLAGFFLPALNTTKLIPLFITIRFITVTGLLLFLTSVWKRKK